ncbi:MAG: HIT family protein [Thiohalospira sp.]
MTEPHATNDFELHPRLLAESYPVGRMTLSRIRLMDDARFPWLLVIPTRPGVSEPFDLPDRARRQLNEEIHLLGLALRGAFEPDRLNVAALGNQVPQLHVHLVARYEGDAAWPAPVWGHGERQPYTAGGITAFLHALLPHAPPELLLDQA